MRARTWLKPCTDLIVFFMCVCVSVCHILPENLDGVMSSKMNMIFAIVNILLYVLFFCFLFFIFFCSLQFIRYSANKISSGNFTIRFSARTAEHRRGCRHMLSVVSYYYLEICRQFTFESVCFNIIYYLLNILHFPVRKVQNNKAFFTYHFCLTTNNNKIINSNCFGMIEKYLDTYLVNECSKHKIWILDETLSKKVKKIVIFHLEIILFSIFDERRCETQTQTQIHAWSITIFGIYAIDVGWLHTSLVVYSITNFVSLAVFFHMCWKSYHSGNQEASLDNIKERKSANKKELFRVCFLTEHHLQTFNLQMTCTHETKFVAFPEIIHSMEKKVEMKSINARMFVCWTLFELLMKKAKRHTEINKSICFKFRLKFSFVLFGMWRRFRMSVNSCRYFDFYIDINFPSGGFLCSLLFSNERLSIKRSENHCRIDFVNYLFHSQTIFSFIW